jgi:hypothetical protein
MVNPEIRSDLVEDKKERSRDSSMAKKGIAKAKKKKIKQFRKEKKIFR